MPRVRRSNNLDDYGRTRQWQLRRQLAASNRRSRDSSNYNCEPRNHREDSAADVDMHGDTDEVMNNDEISSTTINNHDDIDSESLSSNDENSPNDDDSEESESSEEDADVNEEEEIENNDIPDELNGTTNDWNLGNDDDDEPLYTGATITVGEAMLTILTFALKFSLSGACFISLLKLIVLLIPATPRFRKTAHMFYKYFAEMKSPLIRHYYCSRCFSQLEATDNTCSCNEPVSLSYFLQIPLISQLQNLFSKPGFVEDLNHRIYRDSQPGHICDIYDGEVYKKYTGDNGLLTTRNNLSFMFYVDGVPVFKSSKCKLWPIYLIINELPYHKRILKENIIVAGLWFGPTNPKANLFMQPLHSEMLNLRRGVNFNIIGSDTPQKVKAVLISGTCDIPAKADFLNHTHHNGFYGCTLCYSPGYNVSGSNFGNTHIYPFEGSLYLRCAEDHKNHGQLAYHASRNCSNNRQSAILGVKGPTILSSIMSDHIHGIAVDVMHCVFQGVVPKLAFLWLDSSLRYEKFSLYTRKSIIDDRLTKIKPILSVSRLPRSITDNLSHWKASEWRNFFYYYSVPVLHDIMPKKYFDHYLQLVTGVYILNRNSISPEMLRTAEELLIAFVSNFQSLYDPRFMSINFHLLLHLADSVRNTGPLWVTSCFPFEDLNGHLLKYIHGTTHVGLQISSKIAYSIIITNIVETLNDNSEAKKFCKTLLTVGKRINHTERINESTYVVGKVKSLREVSERLINQLIEAGCSRNNLNISSFRGIKKNGQIIYNMNYTKVRSYLSYGVLYKIQDSYEIKIGYVESFLRICNCPQQCLLNNCPGRFLAVIREGTVNNLFKTTNSMILNQENNWDSQYSEVTLEHISRFEVNGCSKIIPINDIMSSCFCINVDSVMYVASIVNKIDFKGYD